MQRRILIVRQDRIGDAVLATPLPREIKRRWPDAYVGMLVRGYTRDLFAHDPQVDVVLTDDFTPATATLAFWARVRELRRHRFTHGLMLLADARMAYLLAAAGIPRRLGHGITLYHALSLARPVMARKFHKGRHEGAYSLDLLRALGVEPASDAPELHLSAAEQELAARCRGKWGAGGRRIVGIHATSGKSAPNWEPGLWAELATRLAADSGVQVVVTDNMPPPELDAVVGAAVPNRGLGLRTAMAHISALDVLVSASTGPMHMAAALGVPTVSLFCPLPSCEPALWGPVGNHALMLLPETPYCRDRCPGDPHVCTFDGSHDLTPARVAAEVTRLLAARKNPPA